jgi:predicted Zn finger-like uncharacterized protein
MIVTCPSCRSKYCVQPEAIGSGKLVRCAVCCTTWQQCAVNEIVDEKYNVRYAAKWAFFWLVVLSLIFSLFFAKDFAIKIWPPVTELYNVFDIKHIDKRKLFVMKNISNFFVQREDKLYMGLKGELINTSKDIQYLPSITISLRDDDSVGGDKRDVHYNKVWIHNMMYKKLLPNQKIIFETELQNVPYNNLVCDIKLNT